LAELAFQIKARRGLFQSSGRRADLTRDAVWSYALLSPFLIVYFIFCAGSILVGLGLSVMKWDGVHEASFIGLDNFQQVFTNKPILKAFGNLFYFVAFAGSGRGGGRVEPGAVHRSVFRPELQRSSGRSFCCPSSCLCFSPPAIWLWMLVPQFGLFNQLTSVFDNLGLMCNGFLTLNS